MDLSKKGGEARRLEGQGDYRERSREIRGRWKGREIGCRWRSIETIEGEKQGIRRR